MDNKVGGWGSVGPLRVIFFDKRQSPPYFVLENLYQAYRQCRRRKRNTCNALAFEINRTASIRESDATKKKMKFEWDTKKEQTNINKHGVSFEQASYVFADPYALNQYDDDH